MKLPVIDGWENEGMKYYMIVAILLLSSLAFAANKQASCVIDDKSILSGSPSGVPQVSNLGLIQITCRVPGRPWPSDPKPGFGRFALRLKTVAYQIGDDGTKTVVPSFSNVTGGSDCGPFQISGECNEASLLWNLNIPIDPTEAIAEIREFDRKLEVELSPEQRQQAEAHIRDLEKHPDELAEIVRQYRPGNFVIECRIMDGDQLWAFGHVELEIVFKGRAFDALIGKLPQSNNY
ncbi:MAG TPA: hypothetical protein VH088_07110 [Terriglobales bacterium]|nr:hypothetical protein [Terriglobales bacterium]